MTVSPTSYSVQVGQNVSIPCYFTNANVSLIVWKYYPTGNPLASTSIYVDSDYFGGTSLSKYAVTMTVTGPDITAVLTIMSVTNADALNTYQCECNTYKSMFCASARPLGTATLSAYTTTTTTSKSL